MVDCLFCQLINQKKVDLVYASPSVVAFADISPKAPVHLLIVPRKHISSVLDLSEVDKSLVGQLFLTAKELAEEKNLSHRGFRCVMNTGPEAGQTMHHLHLHLLGGQPLGEMIH